MTTAPNQKYNVSTVKIPSATPGWNLDAWVYLPESASKSNPSAVICMAPGLTVNKKMSFTGFAERFGECGWTTIMFDYRRWGASDGTPRHHVNVNDQHADYKSVVDYARSRDDLDSERITLWGASFSGGHVITLGSKIPGLCAVLTQGPFTGANGRPSITWDNIKPTPWIFWDLFKQFFGFQPSYITVAGLPGTVAVFTEQGARKGLLGLAQNPGDYQNEISASSLIQVLTYNPLADAKYLKIPFLIVQGRDDNVTLPHGPENVIAAARHGELVVLPGAGHWDLYPGKSHWHDTLNAQTTFLSKVFAKDRKD